jgi:AcrR family transcriptional regulator
MTMTAKKPRVPAAATRERLLDAAEALFAQHEFDAVTIREVAELAQARLGLNHYYFKSKEELFRQVLARRVEELSKLRLDMLARFRSEAETAALPVEKVVEAMIHPLLELSLGEDEGWKSYVRLNGRIATSEKYLRLAEGLYDPIAQIFIEELGRSLPSCSRAQLEWGFLFLVSVMSGTFSESGRVERLSDGARRSSDLSAAYRAMVPFIAAGLRAISPEK